jgi:hypothetical protein
MPIRAHLSSELAQAANTVEPIGVDVTPMPFAGRLLAAVAVSVGRALFFRLFRVIEHADVAELYGHSALTP